MKNYKIVDTINQNKSEKLVKASTVKIYGIARPAMPTIHNVVSTVDLKCELNLKQIALKARNAEYNPKRFSAVIMRIRNPKTTALIFKSGKVVCTGAKNEMASR